MGRGQTKEDEPAIQDILLETEVKVDRGAPCKEKKYSSHHVKKPFQGRVIQENVCRIMCMPPLGPLRPLLWLGGTPTVCFTCFTPSLENARCERTRYT